MAKQETLTDRLVADGWHPGEQHAKKAIRAEFSRLARLIRAQRIKGAKRYSEEYYYNAGLCDALAQIREANR